MKDGGDYCEYSIEYAHSVKPYEKYERGKKLKKILK